MKVVEQVPVDSRQLVEPSDPGPVMLNVTVPVGVTGIPEEASETLAEQVDWTFTRMGVVHVTVMLVER